MCGIFGYLSSQPLSINLALKVLEALEIDKLPIDKSPVGGHGAGISFIFDNKVYLYKVGGNNSPAKNLEKIILNRCPIRESNIIIGHVRRASPQFSHTVKYMECTQPYIANCTEKFKVISVHNGFLRNYKEIKEKFKLKHIYESEKISFIDSEVFPHLMEELICHGVKESDLAVEIFRKIEGNNVASLLLIRNNKLRLFIIHKGATRGLYIWKNEQGDIIFSSRRHIIRDILSEVLQKGKYELIFHVEPKKQGEIALLFEI
ncbi:MAG: hypothetical protein NDF55_09050 [archaeon GB-1867-005]|nr:hypothetical protein [Candidatus Culexmicrobium cathedralense]